MEEIRNLKKRLQTLLEEMAGIKSMRRGRVIPPVGKRDSWAYWLQIEPGELVITALHGKEIRQYKKETEAYEDFKRKCDEYALIKELLADLTPEITKK